MQIIGMICGILFYVLWGLSCISLVVALIWWWLDTKKQKKILEDTYNAKQNAWKPKAQPKQDLGSYTPYNPTDFSQYNGQNY